VLPFTFLAGWSYSAVLLVLPALGFFTTASSADSVYLPELFPTRIRATGAGSASMPVAYWRRRPVPDGRADRAPGSFARALSSIAVIYVCGMAVLLFARETRGQALES